MVEIVSLTVIINKTSKIFQKNKKIFTISSLHYKMQWNNGAYITWYQITPIFDSNDKNEIDGTRDIEVLEHDKKNQSNAYKANATSGSTGVHLTYHPPRKLNK
jgi:hypothetical protein